MFFASKTFSQLKFGFKLDAFKTVGVKPTVFFFINTIFHASDFFRTVSERGLRKNLIKGDGKMAETNTLIVTLPKTIYHENDKIYKKSRISLKTGITVLVGCNGCGKSTFLNLLKDKCEISKIPVWKYNNLKQGGDNATQMFLECSGRSDSFIRNIHSSEGENIMNNLGDFVAELGSLVKKNTGADKIVLLLDAVDSGMSIDNINDLFGAFSDTILPDIEKTISNVYLVVTANAYETARNRNCLDVYEGKYITFKDYEEYRQFILDSGKKKEERYTAAAEAAKTNKRR